MTNSSNIDPNERIAGIEQRVLSANERAQLIVQQQRAAQIERHRVDARRLAAKIMAERAAKDAEAAAKRAEVEAAEQKKAEALLKTRLRSAWQGSDEGFEKNWPTMRDDFYRQQALENANALIERKRQSHIYQ